MNARKLFAFAILLIAAGSMVSAADSHVQVSDRSDPRAIEIAQQTVAAMGGWDALEGTRYVRWNFFGRRLHYWDRHTGDIRIESERDGSLTVILMNLHTREGRAFKAGVQLEGTAAAEMLEMGHQAWVNDAYWMFMPYKLLDPGVTLGFVGEKATADGNAAYVLDLTFDDEIGYTPENRYHVYVGQESGLVEQWDFFSKAANEEPDFSSPWKDWQTFGEIKLATSHGRNVDWEIAVLATLEPGLLTDPDAVEQ